MSSPSKKRPKSECARRIAGPCGGRGRHVGSDPCAGPGLAPGTAGPAPADLTCGWDTHRAGGRRARHGLRSSPRRKQRRRRDRAAERGPLHTAVSSGLSAEVTSGDTRRRAELAPRRARKGARAGVAVRRAQASEDGDGEGGRGGWGSGAQAWRLLLASLLAEPRQRHPERLWQARSKAVTDRGNAAWAGVRPAPGAARSPRSRAERAAGRGSCGRSRRLQRTEPEAAEPRPATQAPPGHGCGEAEAAEPPAPPNDVKQGEAVSLLSKTLLYFCYFKMPFLK